MRQRAWIVASKKDQTTVSYIHGFLQRAALALVLGVGLTATAGAHHSYAMFDKNKPLTVAGTVTKIEWKNPHAYLVVSAAAADGQMQRYLLEASSPNELLRWGWKANTVKVGDKVTVDLFMLKNGKPGGLLFKLTTKDGAVYHAH
jgi:hypothetical protein